MKDPFNIQLKQNYVRYRNTLQKMIKNAKRDHINNFVNKNNSRTKSLWSYIDDLCGRCRPKTEIDSFKNSEGIEVAGGERMVEEFNKYFSEISKQLADNIREVPEKRSGEHFCGSTLFLFPTCTNEVKGIISELKSVGAPGEDGIRAEFLKNIREEIAEPLMLLANFCFEAGQFPDILKRGIIKPVYKSGEKTVISNYRPICLTSNISKIIEKLFVL